MEKFVAYIGVRTMSTCEALDGKHITLAYADVNKTDKLPMGGDISSTGGGRVVTVEYWERVDLTVAIVSSMHAQRMHNLCVQNGFNYDLEFIPHVTLGKGDIVKENIDVVGQHIYLAAPFIQIKVRKD